MASIKHEDLPPGGLELRRHIIRLSDQPDEDEIYLPPVEWVDIRMPPDHHLAGPYINFAGYTVWLNSWKTLLLASGVPADDPLAPTSFLVSARDDYILGAKVRSTMAAGLLQPSWNAPWINVGNYLCSARHIFRWLSTILPREWPGCARPFVVECVGENMDVAASRDWYRFGRALRFVVPLV